jgi:Tfp pilus assembly protein PilF
MYEARRGELDRAASELERALDLQAYQPEALVMLAQIRDRQGDRARARALLEEALRFDPQQTAALEGLLNLDAR